MFINYTTRQLAAKIVYFGPALSGKTTNLKQIYLKTAPGARGELVSLETDADRTLFFDLLPIEVGVIGGFQTKFQLYTVPGQVHYESTRTLVLKGVDGLVFVADSQRAMREANAEHFQKLLESLRKVDVSLTEVPLVMQYNKRDLANVMSVAEMNALLNPRGVYPVFESVAGEGQGVFETLKGITKLTLKTIKRKIEAPVSAPPPRPAAPAPEPPRAAAPPPSEEKSERGISFAGLRSAPSESLASRDWDVPLALEEKKEPALLAEDEVPLDDLHRDEEKPEKPSAPRAPFGPGRAKLPGADELLSGVLGVSPSSYASSEKKGPPPKPAYMDEEEAAIASAFGGGSPEEEVMDPGEGSGIFDSLDSEAAIEDLLSVDFDRASEAEQAELEQNEDFLQTREFDADMGLPVKRVAVARPGDIEKTLEEIISITLGKRGRRGLAAPSTGEEKAPEGAIEKEAGLRFPIRNFEGAQALRFDVTLDGDKPLRLRDAVVVQIDNGHKMGDRLVLRLTLRLDARK
jgi:hypothetical protein